MLPKLRASSLLYTTFFKKQSILKDGGTSSGIGKPSVGHAIVIIFLEFFAWGLLTVPVINVLAETFPTNKFLMNGLILGIKGLLSFLSAPLIGALSDIWGRKSFLLLTVFCTCIPIPLLTFSPWWYFAMFSISGVFSVTFSVVLAYVADITDKDERNSAYGMVSATFGASLVISPALGSYLSEVYSDQVVVVLATAIATLDLCFILVGVPESLSPRYRQTKVSWEAADPFSTLRKVGEDPVILSLSLIVFLSYLPEAGQFSCFFVYLKLVVGFSPEAVTAYIGLVGVLAVLAQTVLLNGLQRSCGTKLTVLVGLCLQCIQLTWYGLGTRYWMMWFAGVIAAMSQITYPSISSYISIHADNDKQGAVQGIVTGIRGLCTGLGPALFGLIFYLFNVDLNIADERIMVPSIKKQLRPPIPPTTTIAQNITSDMVYDNAVALLNKRLIPGPPFLCGAVLVVVAIYVVGYLPDLSPVSHVKLIQKLRHRLSSNESQSGSGSSGAAGGGGGDSSSAKYAPLLSMQHTGHGGNSSSDEFSPTSSPQQPDSTMRQYNNVNDSILRYPLIQVPVNASGRQREVVERRSSGGAGSGSEI